MHRVRQPRQSADLVPHPLQLAAGYAVTRAEIVQHRLEPPHTRQPSSAHAGQLGADGDHRTDALDVRVLDQVSQTTGSELAGQIEDRALRARDRQAVDPDDLREVEPTGPVTGRSRQTPTATTSHGQLHRFALDGRHARAAAPPSGATTPPSALHGGWRSSSGAGASPHARGTRARQVRHAASGAAGPVPGSGPGVMPRSSAWARETTPHCAAASCSSSRSGSASAEVVTSISVASTASATQRVA